MPIPVQCPGCQHAFMVGDEFAGKKGKCPKCKQVLRVDEPVFKAVGHSSSAPPPPPPRRSGSSRSLPVPPPLPDDAASAPSNGEPPAMFVAGGHKPGGKADAARYAKRKKSSGLPLPLVIAGGIGALAAIGVTIGIIWSMNNNSGDPAVAKNGDKHATGKDDKTKKSPKDKETPKVNKTDVTPMPPAPLPRDNSPAGLRKRVLALEIKTPMGDVKAAAFVVDDRGYAVTVFHAIASASKVEAITADGKRIPVSGILMPDPFHDLALVKLVLPDDLKLDKLDLLAKDLAVGEKIQGVDLANAAAPLLPGKLMNREAFDKLTVTLQTRLSLLGEEWVKDTSIVKHDVNLSIDSSGTPIISAEGQVQAVHLTSDKGVGLAVSGQYVKDLVARAGTDVKPFANAEAVAAVEPPKTTDPPVTPMPEMPVKPVEPEPPKTAELPKRPMRKAVVDDDYEDLLRKIDDAADECWRRRWHAEDSTDYGVFQEFSNQIMELGKEINSLTITEADAKRLNKFADEMFDQLKGELWPDRKAWEETNKLALAALEANPNQGVFALVRIGGTGNAPIMEGTDKYNIFVGEVVGTGKFMALLVPEQAPKPKVGDTVVAVGVHDGKFKIQINGTESPSTKIRFIVPAKP